jgi:hypothetical protein
MKAKKAKAAGATDATDGTIFAATQATDSTDFAATDASDGTILAATQATEGAIVAGDTLDVQAASDAPADFALAIPPEMDLNAAEIPPELDLNAAETPPVTAPPGTSPDEAETSAAVRHRKLRPSLSLTGAESHSGGKSKPSKPRALPSKLKASKVLSS